MRKHLNHAIDITLKPSLILLGLMIGFSIMVCLIIGILPMSFYIQLLLIFLIILSTTYLILRDVLLVMPWSWKRLQVNHAGKLLVFTNEKKIVAPALHATTFIHPSLIILNIHHPKQSSRMLTYSPLVLMCPPTNTEEHRQLRVWLRWWNHSHAAS